MPTGSEARRQMILERQAEIISVADALLQHRTVVKNATLRGWITRIRRCAVSANIRTCQEFFVGDTLSDLPPEAA